MRPTFNLNYWCKLSTALRSTSLLTLYLFLMKLWDVVLTRLLHCVPSYKIKAFEYHFNSNAKIISFCYQNATLISSK